MNQKEQLFKQSIEKKIKEYEIKTTFNECLKYAENKFMDTQYSDGTTELVEIGIEKFLSRSSPLYFISKYAFISLPGVGKIPANKTLYYFQKEILKTITEWKKIVYQKSRQTGLSTLNALYCYWRCLMFSDESIVIVSKDGKSSQDFLDKIRINVDNIPSFLGLERTVNNVKSLKLSNGSKVESFARSKTAGRGESPSLAVLDECAFYQTESIINGIIASVQASLTKTGGQLVLISTPNGNVVGSEGYFYWNQVNQLMERGGVDLKDRAILHPIQWWEVPDTPGIFPYKGYNNQLNEFIKKNYFTDHSVRLEAQRYFTPIANKWHDNDWLRLQFKTLGPILYRQEILADFVVHANTVFTNDIFDAIQRKIKEPKIKDLVDGKKLNTFQVWKEPEVGHKYCLGIDIASGYSKDSSCIEVLDAIDNSQCAEFLCKCTTYDLAYAAEKIGYYYNTAMIFLESNSIGLSSFNVLNKDLSYPNLYKERKSSNGLTTFVGWTTSTKTRQLIINKLIETLYDPEELNKLGIYSERLLGQLKTFVFGDGGKAEAVGSAHDDAILAYSIALYNVDKAFRDNISFFVDETGRTINVTDTHRSASLNESVYIDAEENMLQQAGVPSLEDYKWILYG